MKVKKKEELWISWQINTEKYNKNNEIESISGTFELLENPDITKTKKINYKQYTHLIKDNNIYRIAYKV